MRSAARILAASGLILGFTASAEAETLRLMTGPQGGAWYPLGGAIKGLLEAAVSGASVQVLPGAGIANVKGVEAGKADLGFGNSVSTVDAIAGNAPFDQKATNTCNVATLYPQYFQAVALADSGVTGAGDLKGKKLTTQPRGNTGEQITRDMLTAVGLRYEDLGGVSLGSYTDSVNLLRDGNAHVFTLGTTIPSGAVMDLISARQVRFIELGDDVFAAMRKINPGYSQVVIKAGSYPGQSADVRTIGYATHIIARCDLDADIVYGLTKALAENTDQLAAVAKAIEGLTPAEMAADTGVPLHKGAARYYRERGALSG